MKKKYTDTGKTSLAKFKSVNGTVVGTLMLDPRHIKSEGNELIPVVIRIASNGKKTYLSIGKMYILNEWVNLCECEKQSRNKKATERKELKAIMSKVEMMVNKLIEEDIFTFQRLQDLFKGKKNIDTRTIYTIWDKYIQDKRKEGKAGTARCNEDIRRRFEKFMGANVSNKDINRNLVIKWFNKMKKEGLSTTSIGISLRTFRAIVNVCIQEGLVKGDTREMFKDTNYNKSNSRKHEFLDIQAMKTLYDFWEKNEAKTSEGKEMFFPKEKNAVFRDLGLFLFMYLGNGQNLADTLRLRYDDWYFSSRHKQLRFFRHKTHDRNENSSEVIFPITPEIKKIIDRYGNKPKLGEKVFPIMKDGLTPDQEMWVIQRYNRYIREHMKEVAEILEMESKPTATWARHSFATNLNNSGMVPYKYISDSMGHSSSGDITSNYIGAYPLEKMLQYNHYLLHDTTEPNRKDKVGTEQALLEMLRNMSSEERESLMSKL